MHQFRISQTDPDVLPARLALQMVLDRGDELIATIECSSDQFAKEVAAFSAAAGRCESQLELIDAVLEAATAYVRAVELDKSDERFECFQSLRIALNALQSSDRKDQ